MKKNKRCLQWHLSNATIGPSLTRAYSGVCQMPLQAIGNAAIDPFFLKHHYRTLRTQLQICLQQCLQKTPLQVQFFVVLIQRDYYPIHGFALQENIFSLFYMYIFSHTRGFLPHSRACSIADYFLLFLIFSPHTKGFLPHSRTCSIGGYSQYF